MGRVVRCWAGALVIVSVMAACGRKEDAAADNAAYRDRTVPIASKALFDPTEYMGLWYEVARYPTPFEAGCIRATFDFMTGTPIGVRHTCYDADDTVRRTLDGTVTVTGPGRLSVNFGGAQFPASDYWVLWTDETYRTAVIGTPDGRAGWILNRQPSIPADRLTAAKEILDFNGYDLSQLRIADAGN